MKKIFLTVLLLEVAYLAGAQGYKLFIDDNGKTTKAFTATSYIVVKQLADSTWFMQQYDMENAILQSGTFKDKNLRTPNGKFTYYRKLNFYNNATMKELLKSDTVNCIMTEGEFKDGKKNGKWTDYLIGGKKREEASYKDGVLNGPYRSYNDDHTTIALSGNYVNGKREGEWNMYGLNGKLMETDEYRNGKMRKRKLTLSPYNSSEKPKGFEVYVNNALRKVVPPENIAGTAHYLVVFTVTVNGNVIKPELAPPGQEDAPLVKMLFSILEDSPRWKPANAGDETKPVEDFAMISVEISNSSITTKVLDYPIAKALYFNLTH